LYKEEITSFERMPWFYYHALNIKVLLRN